MRMEMFLTLENSSKTETKITAGMTYTSATDVDDRKTARSVGSGTLDVFATPAMTALMEHAACTCIAPLLQPDQASVGTEISIKHTAATPVGATVRATATVIDVDRRKITFTVTAYDEVGEIGTGTHTRFIVEKDKFMKKARRRVQ